MLQAIKPFYDQYGRPISFAEKIKTSPKANNANRNMAIGLYGSTWSPYDAGKYQNRYYTLGDTEQGLDSLSRENLVKWSREMYGQLPIVSAAVSTLSRFTVGDKYQPEYIGNNSAKGKIYTDYLTQVVYPNICTRGKNFDMLSLLKVLIRSILIDGDILSIFGRDRFGSLKVQYIPSHRIRSNGNQFVNSSINNVVPYSESVPNTVIADGVVQNYDGEVVGYNVVDYNNLVDQSMGGPQLVDKFISVNNSQLLFSALYIDKPRGVPAIGSAILQALSIQELDRYLMDKIKIESMVGLIEKNQSGEGPQEFQNTLERLDEEQRQGITGITHSPNTHGIQVVQGPEIRYVRSDGGDIKTLSSNTPGDQTTAYMQKLETQVLSTLGVPHQLIYSMDAASGKISMAASNTFNAAIDDMQTLLDKHVKFIIGLALANGIQRGDIPPSPDERVDQIFELTHPEDFTFNAQYERSADLADIAAGVKTYGDISKKSGRTYTQLIQTQEKEEFEFYQAANRVAKGTGVDVNIIIQGWRNKIITNPPLPAGQEPQDNNLINHSS